MKVMVIPEKYNDGSTGYYDAEVSHKDFVLAAFQEWKSMGQKLASREYCAEVKLDPSFMKKLAGQDEKVSSGIRHTNPREVFATLTDSNWLVINWKGDTGDKFGYGFMRLESWATREHPSWKYVVIPRNCEVDSRHGHLTIQHEGQPLYYPARVWPWPIPLHSPEPYQAIGIMNHLLNAEDENPLTMLACAGHQPCKGAAKQVIKTLQKLRDSILTNPDFC